VENNAFNIGLKATNSEIELYDLKKTTSLPFAKSLHVAAKLDFYYLRNEMHLRVSKNQKRLHRFGCLCR